MQLALGRISQNMWLSVCVLVSQIIVKCTAAILFRTLDCGRQKMSQGLSNRIDFP